MGKLSDSSADFVLSQLRNRLRRLRLLAEEREELLGRIVLWVFENRDPGRPVTEAWLAAAVATFYSDTVRRGRARARREVPIGEGDAVAAESVAGQGSAEELVIFDELGKRLSPEEKQVVRDRLEGRSWAEALDRIGVRRGSQDKWRKRLREKFRA